MFESVIDTLKQSFGESLIYKGVSGSLDHSFIGVFDESFTRIEPETGERVTSDEVSILLKLSDLPETPVNRAQFVARSKTYRARSVEKDGQGSARIFLSEKDV